MIDHNYFENINSEHKAYFLGFLLSDGNISKTTNRICFTINSQDSYILEEFKKSVGSSNQVRHYKVFDNRTNKYYNSTIFQISSAKIKKDLESLGINYNKTQGFNVDLNIPENLFNHFLRGVFDGDGHVSKNRARISLISTKEFLNKIVSKFFNSSYNLINVCKNKNVFKLLIQEGQTCLDFLKYLYSDATIYLHRKYKLYLNMQNIVEKGVMKSKRKEVLVYDINYKLLYSFSTVKECTEYFNISNGYLSTLMHQNKNFIKNHIFEYGKTVSVTHKKISKSKFKYVY